MKAPTHIFRILSGISAVSPVALVAFGISVLPVTSQAQLAGVGTPGDRAVYTVGAAGATIADVNGLPGNSLVHDFDTTTLPDTSGSFDLGANGVVSLTGGHHIVLYGNHFDSIEDRSQTDSFLKLNGAAIPYGASSGYTRDGGNDDLFARGGTILNVAQADTIEVETERVDVQADNQGARAITEQSADVQFIKLDDLNHQFLRLSRSASAQIMGNNASGPVNISYDVQDETGAAFAHSTVTDPDQITLVDVGTYLVFANSGFNVTGATNRNEITQRITLNGTPLDGGATTVYVRNASNTDGAGAFCRYGAASIGVLVQTTAANTILRVQITRDNQNSGSQVAVDHERTGLAIAKLNDTGEYITLTGAAQNVNTAAPTVRDFSASANVSNPSFTYDSGASVSAITVNKAGTYLFLSSHYGTSTGPTQTQRMIVEQAFQTTPNGGSAAALGYGSGGIYNRDDTGGADRSRNSGTWAGAVMSLGVGDAVETTTDAYSSTADTITTSSLGIQGINIDTISTIPTIPIIAKNDPLNTQSGTTGNVISDENHLSTSHVSDGPADLTYTLDTVPAAGSLRLSGGAPLIVGNTFTQDDIDNDRLTYDAPGSSGTHTFDFTVRDLALNPVSDTFTINIGDPTVVGADAAATDEDTQISEADLTTGANLLANDTGTSLTISGADSTSANGAAVNVTLGTSGAFTYDPTGSATLQALDDGDQVMDTFTYTVDDIFGASTPGTVTITVDGVNDDPVVGNESFTGHERSVTTGNLLSNDSDVDSGDTLSVATFNGGALGTVITPKGATVTIAADGSFTYDPCTSATLTSLATGASDFETIAYEVTDGTATVGGSVTVTTFGEPGSSANQGTVDASGAGDNVNIAVLANDTTTGAAGAPTAGAPFDLNAGDGAAGNTDGAWNNSNAGSGGTVTMENAGTGSVLSAVIANAPPGIAATYDLSGTGSGGVIGDADTTGPANYLYGSNFSTSSYSIEVAMRPDDHIGPEPIWGTGGDGIGSSLVLIGDQLIFTIGQSPLVAQAIGTIPAGATAGGDYVHVVGTFDIATDTASLYINNALVGQGTALNITTGAAANITDWSGSDDEGVGRSQGTTGGDINAAPFLGAQGTTDIPDFNEANDRFDGEISIMRVYDSALSAADVTANFEAIFGAITAPVVGNIVDLAGETTLTPGSTVVTLPSGATVALEIDGSLTYDANGAFPLLGVGQSVIDTFTYTLDTELNAVATVKITVNGTNTDPQVTINQAGSQSDPALNAPVNFTAVFSEAVQGFGAEAGDVDLGASTAPGALVATVTEIAPNDGTTYDVEVSGMTGTGTVVASIPAAAAQRPVTLEDSLPSTSTDNSVHYVHNVAPEATNLVQAIHLPAISAGTMAMLDAVQVTDANNASESRIADSAGSPTFTQATGTKFNTAGTIAANGFALDAEFTPTAADVATGGGPGFENRRTLFDIGGDANGSGVYLIDGVLVLLVKMNGTATNEPAGIPDTDWNAFNTIAVPLSGVLPADETVTLALVFDLDTVRFSLNSAPEVLVPTLNRGTRSNWHGDNTVSIGAPVLPGNGGGLSQAAGSWAETDFLGLDNPVTSLRFWNTSGPSVGIGEFEEVTVTVTIDGHVDDATSGSLSSSGGSYAPDSGVWTITGMLAEVNTALADLKFTFGTAPPPATLSISIEDGGENGAAAVTGTVAISTTIVGGVVYVDDDFSGSAGDAIADADGGPPASPATFLIDAFTNLADALGAIDDSSTVIVNDGDYSADTASLLNTQSLICTNTAGPVTIGSLSALATNTIDLQGNTLEVVGTGTIACTIDDSVGGANFGKTGPGLLILQDVANHTGTTTVGAGGTLRIGTDGVALLSALAGNGPVVCDGRLEFDPALDTQTITQTGAISGTGVVASMGDGTVVFDGAGANTFSGGFELGDGTTSNFDGTAGNRQGFVVVNHKDHLGTGTIHSRGSQLQAGTTGIVIPNAIDIDAGGFRCGGTNDFSFSGNINPVNNNNRGFGNYGLEGLDLTIDGDINTDGGSALFEGTNNADNGTWTVNGDVSGSNNLITQASFDDGEVTFNGVHTHTGLTNFEAGTTFFNATATGGGAFTVLAGATLAGTGSTDSTLTVDPGGTFSPGASPGIFSCGNLTLAGTLEVELDNNTPGTGHDQIQVTGTVDVTGSTLMIIAGAGLTNPGTLAIIDNDDGGDPTTGTFAGLGEGAALDPGLLGWNGSISYMAGGGSNNDVALSFGGYTIIGQWRVDNYGDPGNAGAGANAAMGANGRTNLENFALGFDANGTGDGNNLTFSGGSITQLGGPRIWEDPATGIFYFQYTRRSDYMAAGLILTEIFSRDLSMFEPDPSAIPAVVATGTGDDGVPIQGVQVELPGTLPVSGGKARFAELEITITP